MTPTDTISHEIRWHQGFDCIRFECAHGSDRCYHGSGGSHGVHGLEIEFISLGPLGAISFRVFTGWLPERGRFDQSYGPQPASVTVHRVVSDNGDTSEDQRECDILATKRCKSDVWYSGIPDHAFLSLLNGGIDKLWEYLDGLYQYSFCGGEFPAKYDYPFAPRT